MVTDISVLFLSWTILGWDIACNWTIYISADHFPTGAAHDFDAQHPTDSEPNESPERVTEIGKRPGSLPSAYFSFLSLTALGEEEERHRLSSLSFIPHCIAAPPIYIVSCIIPLSLTPVLLCLTTCSAKKWVIRQEEVRFTTQPARARVSTTFHPRNKMVRSTD